MEKQIEIEKTVEQPIDAISTDGLIIVKQIPIIEERLAEIKQTILNEVEYALSLECTEETKQEIKNLRTGLTKQYNALEKDRKKIKSIVLGPYAAFEEVYKDCVTNIFKPADMQLKGKITAVENAQKAAKREKAEKYFDEYAKGLNIDFVTFDDVPIEVTLSLSEKKLKETAAAFLDRVAGELAMIETQEHKAEILVEYKKCLNAAQAITAVSNRYKAIEEEKARLEQLRKIAEQQAAHEKSVDEAITAQQEEMHVTVVAEKAEPEKLGNCTFGYRLLGVTRQQAKEVKAYIEEYLERKQINYEFTK
ncbi:MAG: DUF1351 domain-containing protein [Clostridiales bacterium]|nr:DUF1351 domain-containing protein [Clostridiales bacterium]